VIFHSYVSLPGGNRISHIGNLRVYRLFGLSLDINVKTSFDPSLVAQSWKH
jgi:hypothetical protein